jgi:hypothetical protein
LTTQPSTPADDDLPGLEHGSAETSVESDDAVAERAKEEAADVSDAYEAANERGANVEGEGAVDDREGRV